MSDVAERIRRMIETRGTTARALARAAGLSHSTVSAVLDKLDANPDARVEARTLDKIAAALEVDAAWLRTGRGEMDGNASTPSPDIQSELRSSVARFFNLPNWAALLRAAKALEPTLPDWVWQRLALAAPLALLRRLKAAGELTAVRLAAETGMPWWAAALRLDMTAVMV